MALYHFPQQPPHMWATTMHTAPIVSLVQLPILSPPAPSLPPPLPPPLKAVNDIPLTRKLLGQVLIDFSERLYHSFRRQVRLVVHGGAVMVLHKAFSHRESTQDIDYVHRSFVNEYRALGFSDAEQRLRSCIADTARKFGLGADWMNDHADVALPWALDQQGRSYDPIFFDSTRPQTVGAQTIFNSRGLALVAVPWPWAMALKLVRYEKHDPADCAAVIRLGAAQRSIRWTCEGLEQWIMDRCWPMRYNDYSAQKRQQLRERIQDALSRAFPLDSRGSVASPPMLSRAPSGEVPLYFR